MQRNLITQIQKWLVLLVAVAFLSGCAANGTQATASPENSPENAAAVSSGSIATSPATSTPATSTPAQSGAKQTGNNLPRLQGKATVVITVKGQPITIELDGSKTPLTAGNFVDLVNKGVYDGLVFHRVIREPQPFVAQGGDPQGKDTSVPLSALGTGGYIDPATNRPRNIPLEIVPSGATEPTYSRTISVPPLLRHTRGAVAMARSQSPDSASSQFYIALADLPFLDGSYAVFGYVTEGIEVVDQIQQGDRIDTAKVTQGLENLQV